MQFQHILMIQNIFLKANIFGKVLRIKFIQVILVCTKSQSN